MSAEPGDSRPEPPLPSRIVLRGGTIHDPAHDRDGVVDRSEARHSEFLDANFERIDLDRDGKITLGEMRAFDAKRAAKP